MSYTKMGEVKSVKVDNWGVFFLQKLQNFFNKTDYCDLTLQFNDNSQLKVHRLVLSACTDYFNVLEQTCEVVDDILIMPRGLQADVVVPIVNFMYTGTLEFEISMYSRLLRTARDMNMTVLLKLLEAHKRTVESSRPQIVKRPPPKVFANRRPATLARTPVKVEQPYITAGTSSRRIPLSAYQCKTLQIKPVTPSTSYYPQIPSSESASIVTKYAHGKTPVKGPSRFDCNDDTILPPDSFEQFDSISYESKPLITANQICKEDLEDYDNLIPAHDTSATFEQLRKSYTNNKRPSSSVSSFDSPPEKKPNIQDVKEYAEQQLMRKQIAAEYDDDNEFEDVLDDEFHNDDDDEDYVPPPSVQKQTRKSAIVIKQERDQKPTIVVKDTAGSNVNHAKIISEVLKKYPHLVKNNKNIKLKIMAKSTSSATQNIVIKQEPMFDQSGTQMEIPRSITVNIPKSLPVQTSNQTKPTNVRATVTQPAPTLLKSKTVPSPVAPAPAPVAPVSNTPRRIDSKTMHALIAKGAENTTGPWLCLRCGINGRPISIPSYRGFRRHLTNTHKEKVDPRLCEHCGWRSQNNRDLYHHMKALHQINPPPGYDFPKCDFCSNIFINKAAKELHIKEDHPEKIAAAQQHCMYCDGIFEDEDILYNHMQSRHKLRAQKDGLIDYTDDEDEVYYGEAPAEQGSESKIKILSNIAIPQSSNKPGATISLEPSSEAAALSTVATGIATSLGLIDSSDSQEIQYLEESDFINAGGVTEPKFVNADGHIMELTPEQREEIISQLDNQHEGGVVMVLNEEPFEVAAAEAAEITEDADPLASTSKNKDEEKSDAEKSPVKVNETETEEPMEWQNDSQSSVEQTTKAKVNNEDDDDDEKEDPELKDAEEDDDSEADDDEKDPKDGDKTVDKAKIESAKENLKLLTGDWSDDEEDEPEDVPGEPEDVPDEPVAEPETKPSEVKENENTVESKEEEADVEEEPTHENTEIPEKEILFETLTGNDEKETDEKNIDDAKINDKSTEDDDDESKETKNTAAEEDEESVGKVLAEDEDEGGQTEETETTKLSEEKEEADEDETEKIPSDEKKITRSVSKERSSLEKDEDKTESKNPPGKNDSKKKDGADPIRSLINDWGDDDDEDDEDL